MKTSSSRQLQRLLILLDILLIVLIYLVSYDLQVYLFPSEKVDFQSHAVLLPLMVVSFIWGMAYSHAYKRLNIPASRHIWMIVSGLSFAVGAVFTVLFLFEAHYFSRVIVGAMMLGTLVLLLVVRQVLIWWYIVLGNGMSANLTKVLIVGTGERALKVAELMSKDSDWGVSVIGHLDTDVSRVGEDILGAPVLGDINDVQKVLKANIVDEIVVSVPRSMLSRLEPIYSACEEEGIKLRLMADIFDFKAAKLSMDAMGNVPLLSFEPVAQNENGLILKRIFDMLSTFIILIVALPLMLLVALAVRIESPGPVIFVQQRVGIRKRMFPMYKFRSMVVDAEEKIKEIEHLNEADGPNFKIKDDPRITRVGKFIRKTSIDELPQLINVLLGDMSLVGPRPMSIRDVELFDRGLQRKRFSVRPGITCIWQISGRSNLTFDQWLELDLRYIDSWSLKLDIMILLKTVPVLLKREGAV